MKKIVLSIMAACAACSVVTAEGNSIQDEVLADYAFAQQNGHKVIASRQGSVKNDLTLRKESAVSVSDSSPYRKGKSLSFQSASSSVKRSNTRSE